MGDRLSRGPPAGPRALLSPHQRGNRWGLFRPRTDDLLALASTAIGTSSRPLVRSGAPRRGSPAAIGQSSDGSPGTGSPAPDAGRASSRRRGGTRFRRDHRSASRHHLLSSAALDRIDGIAAFRPPDLLRGEQRLVPAGVLRAAPRTHSAPRRSGQIGRCPTCGWGGDRRLTTPGRGRIGAGCADAWHRTAPSPSGRYARYSSSRHPPACTDSGSAVRIVTTACPRQPPMGSSPRRGGRASSRRGP